MRGTKPKRSILITVTEDKKDIVVEGSQVALRLESMNTSCAGDIYGMVAPRCFNVDHLTWCQRELVSNAMKPSSYVPSRRDITRQAMNSMVKDVWIKRLGRSQGFKVGMIGYHAVDNTMGLHGFVDCMLNTSDLVSNIVFRYASSTDMISIKENGPYKRDAITALMTGYMVHCPDSIIIYGHGKSSLVFQLRRVDSVIDSVRKKCSKMGRLLMLGELPPPCRSHKCRFCQGTLNKEKK